MKFKNTKYNNMDSRDIIFSFLTSSAVIALVSIAFSLVFYFIPGVADGMHFMDIIFSAPVGIAFGSVICSLVLGCVSIQSMRFMILCGETRKEAFNHYLIYMLQGLITEVAIMLLASLVYLMRDHSLNLIRCVVVDTVLFSFMFFAYGLFCVMITTCMSVKFSIPLLIALPMILFLGVVNAPSVEVLLELNPMRYLTAIIVGLIFLIAGRALFLSKWSNLKTTTKDL